MVDAPHAAPASAAPNRTGNDHEPSAPAGALPRGPRDGVGAVPAGPLSGPLGAAHGPVPALAAPDFASIKLINTNDGAPSPTDTVCGADSDDAFNKPTGKFVPELLRRTAPISEVLEQRLQAVQAGDSDDDSHEDAFFAGDLGEVVRQYAKFRRLLPRVVPHYAVKCNPDDLIVKTLVELGASFDCASKGEIDQVLKLGVQPSSIIYANPCKPASHLRFARTTGVTHMTFDNADELAKIKQHHPEAKLVLRILTDDSRSVCRFGIKFGADYETACRLLRLAKEMDMELVGVSFHVGSGCYDATAFRDAVIAAKAVFDEAKEVGYDLRLLDVGGGFPGSTSTGITFEQIAAVLGPSIDEFFGPEIRVIAEPGRYFVSAAYTLAVNITARRVVQQVAEGTTLVRSSTPALAEAPESDGASTLADGASVVAEDPDKLRALTSTPRVEGPIQATDRAFMYYINDGTYGSFNCIYFDHVQPIPRVLMRSGEFTYGVEPKATDVHYPCSIWGPTCDSMDCVTKNGSLPELRVGDWLYCDSMGAYTLAAGSEFNGFRKSRVEYTNTEVPLMMAIMEGKI